MKERPAAASLPLTDDLVRQLVAGSRADEAVAFLRARAAAGRRYALGQLVALLLQLGQLDAALEAVRDDPDLGAARVVARSLMACGRGAEAVELFRTVKGVNVWDDEIVELLAEAGLEEEINARANTGDSAALSWRLDRMVAAGRGDEAIAMLRARMTTDRGVLWPLANLLGQQGRLDEATALMRRYADAGDTDAQAWLDAAEAGTPFWARTFPPTDRHNT
jgi:tetratricopeptide (TPR) repeat protein